MMIYLKIQQPQILEIMWLPIFSMSGSCGLSKIQDVSMLLQVKNLHTREGASSIPCFSAQFAEAARDARRSGAGEFAQTLIVGWEAFLWCDCSVSPIAQLSGIANNHLMISSCWYDMHNLHHILLLVKISWLCLRPVIVAAQCGKGQIGIRLLNVNWWSQPNMTDVALPDIFIHTQAGSFKGSKHPQLCLPTTDGIYGLKVYWICLYACKIINSGNIIRVQNIFLMSSKGTPFLLPDDHFVEDAVLLPFGLCHQSCTTTPLSLILRFNGEDPLRLSSVMVQQNLQLSPPKPRVHTPDRPSGEPPAGHQLV